MFLSFLANCQNSEAVHYHHLKVTKGVTAVVVIDVIICHHQLVELNTFDESRSSIPKQWGLLRVGVP